MGHNAPVLGAPLQADEGYLPKLLPLSILDEAAPEIPVRLIYPFIRPGDMIFLVAPAGAGKTTLAAETLLALCGPLTGPSTLAGGTMRVNRDAFPMNRALIIDGDNWPQDWTYILRLLQKSTKLSDADFLYTLGNIRHIRFDEANLGSKQAIRAAIDDLVFTCEHHGINFLVIDPVHKVFGMQDNADITWVLNGLSVLRDQLKPRGITALCLAHPAHTNPQQSIDRKFMPLGHSQQLGMIDVRLGLRKLVRRSLLFKFKDRAARWIPDGSRVELLHTTLGAGFTSGKGAEDWQPFPNPLGIALDPTTCRILGLLPPNTVADFTIKQLPHRADTVRSIILNVLVPNGLIAQVEGTGTNNRNPRRWTMTQDGLNAQTVFGILDPETIWKGPGLDKSP